MSERESFEAWAKSIGYKDEFYFFTNSHPNHYDDDRTEDMWAAWQASREALKDGQGEPTDSLRDSLIKTAHHMILRNADNPQGELLREIGRLALSRLDCDAGNGFMFVPVADLYELQLKSGSPYCYTSSSSEAHGWAKEGYPIREYVLLDRLQDAMNHPIDTTSQQYEALSKGESK